MEKLWIPMKASRPEILKEVADLIAVEVSLVACFQPAPWHNKLLEVSNMKKLFPPKSSKKLQNLIKFKENFNANLKQLVESSEKILIHKTPETQNSMFQLDYWSIFPWKLLSRTTKALMQNDFPNLLGIESAWKFYQAQIALQPQKAHIFRPSIPNLNSKPFTRRLRDAHYKFTLDISIYSNRKGM
jgi:hypothetical protein